LRPKREETDEGRELDEVGNQGFMEVPFGHARNCRITAC
jgi:hypothetical protein